MSRNTNPRIMRPKAKTKQRLRLFQQIHDIPRLLGDICNSRPAQLFHAKSLTAPASDRNLHLLNSLFHSFTFHFALKSANPIPASTLHWKSCYRTPSDLLLSRKPHQPTATQTASATILLADPGAITLAPSVGRPQISPKACHSGV